MKGYNHWIKYEPNLPVWHIANNNSKPSEMKFQDGFNDYLQNADVANVKWRKRSFNDLRIVLRPIWTQNIGEITFKKLDQLLRNNSKNPNTINKRYSVFINYLRFIHNGNIRKISANKKPKSDKVEIVQAEVITEEQALLLIQGARSKHYEFRESLREKLETLQDGQSYAFVPENLPDDPEQHKDDIKKLKGVIAGLLTQSKLPFTKHYVQSKNLFVFIRKKSKEKN